MESRTMNAITSYFDLTNGLVPGRPGPSATSAKPPVLPQYFALAAGVVAEPFVHAFIKNGNFGGVGNPWTLLIFGLLIAIIIFPGVYKNAFDPERPIFVQLCAIFASGIGWQSLFQAATKATVGG
jgi:hypothetical protein